MSKCTWSEREHELNTPSECRLCGEPYCPTCEKLRAERDQARRESTARRLELEQWEAGAVEKEVDRFHLVSKTADALRERDAARAEAATLRAALERIASMACLEHGDDEHVDGCGVAVAQAALAFPGPGAELLEVVRLLVGALTDVSDYVGGASNATEDEHVMGRVDAALAAARKLGVE